MAGRLRTVFATALAGAALLVLPAHAAAADPPVVCTDNTDDALRLDMDVRAGDTGQLEHAFGYYAVPNTPPKGIVMFDHGHSNSAWKWRDNLRREAAQLGVIAVAMDYRRQTFPGGDITQDSFGWRVQEGAEDTIAAAQLFDRQCLTKLYGPHHGLPIVVWGVSMGGNTAGLAVAMRPKREDGSPLWDYWFDIEGVTNVIETYLEARLISLPPLNNSGGKTAVAEIEQEMGGPFGAGTAPAYVNHDVVGRGDDIKASGVKGVVIVHGIDDGTVPVDQSAEMFLRLLTEAIPTDIFAVGLNGGAPSGNTLEDDLPKLVPGYKSPLTGHGGENDPTQPVIRTGFDRLAAFFDRQDAPNCFRAFLVNGTSVLPDPSAFKLPRCAG